MHTVISTARKAHYGLMAAAQTALGNTVSMYTSMPRKMLKGFPVNMRHHFVPAPVTGLEVLLRPHFHPTRLMNDVDCAIFDQLAALRLQPADLVAAAATSCMMTGKAAHRLGAKFVVDRACPDIRVQEALVREEAAKAGGEFISAPKWFLDRQIAEYEEADFILSPSNYSGGSFPPHLKAKVVVAPLIGRMPVVQDLPSRAEARPFTVAVVGGQPLRKGYLYLLEAWQRLGWSDARLLLRTGPDLLKFKRLEQLMDSLPNVSLVGYVPNLSDFFFQCDAFILPSVDDGFGMALFEAMAHGVPCIATSSCGSSELLQPERDFLLIPPGDSGAIAGALERLRESPQLRESLSVNGRSAVAELQKDSSVVYRNGIAELMRRAFPGKA